MEVGEICFTDLMRWWFKFSSDQISSVQIQTCQLFRGKLN